MKSKIWFLAVIVLVAALVRLRLLNVPFERDEGEYAYAGQLILSGVPPYTLLYNMKLPGTYLAYAFSMALFGQTIAGARLGLILATSATCVGVFLLARRFVPGRDALAGAAGFTVLALSTEMLGPFGHATHFVALFATWGFVALTIALERGGQLAYLGSGLLLGIATLMKQPGAVFVACAVLWILCGSSSRKSRDLAMLLVGTTIPFALLGLWLLLSGSLASFWLWVVRYSAAYGTMQGLAQGWDNLLLATSRFLPQAAFLWLFAACGAALLLTRRYSSQARLRLGALLLFSLLGVCPGLYFRDHYFLLLLPVAALLIGVASGAISSAPAIGRWLAPGLILLACGQAFYSQREIFFRAKPADVSRLVYGPDLFPESVEIGRYLRAHSRSQDCLVVFGSEPQIMFYAQRRSATGFIYMYPLMERHPHTREMQELMIHEVEERRPAYAVLIKTPTSWLERPETDHHMQDWAQRYIGENYIVTGQVVVSEEGTRYLWEAEAARVPVGENTQALVLRRRDFVVGR